MPGAITKGPSSNTAQQLSTAPPHMHQQRQPPAGHTGYPKGHGQMHVPQAVPQLQQLNMQHSTLPNQSSILVIFRLAATSTVIIWAFINKSSYSRLLQNPLFFCPFGQLGRHDRLGIYLLRVSVGTLFAEPDLKLLLEITFAKFVLYILHCLFRFASVS